MRIPDILSRAGRWSGGLVVLCSVGLLALESISSGGMIAGKDRSDRCRPKGSITILENRVGRIFADEPVAPSEDRKLYTTYQCAFDTGRVIEVDDPFEASFAYRPPAMDLAGRLLAYAIDSNSVDGPSNTSIIVRDLSQGPRYDDTVLDVSARTSETQLAPKIGSVVANPGGGVAWISCPQAPRVDGTRGPTCLRPGHPDHVFKVDSGTKRRRLLASGSDIDPGSLRLRGSRLTWRQGGRTRSATLR